MIQLSWHFVLPNYEQVSFKLEKKQTLKLSQSKLDQVKVLHLVKH